MLIALGRDRRALTSSYQYLIMGSIGATFIVIGIGMAMERALGQNQAQGWEFYAVTAALFLTLAFPGFVYRYLVHRGGR